MGDRALIPWTEVHTWSCVACGNCCLGYRVPLRMDEMVKVSSIYGPDVLEYGMGKAYLKNQPNGRCLFQRPLMNRWICTLQGIKPTACRVFPFRIHSKPVYKRGDNAGVRFQDKMLYLYMDPDCHGIVPGTPSERFKEMIVPEVLSMGLGLQIKQRYTTSKSIHWRPV
jgi:Fe-S-cluster containining protein